MSETEITNDAYQLSTQVGFNLRRANQRHVAIFARHVDGLTPTQFAALARLYEQGTLSQNLLGRETAMDSATIKGVVERLKAKGLVTSRPDLNDQRLRLVELTADGRSLFEHVEAQALAARAETMAPLTAKEAAQFEALLAKLV
ncbi:HTH-type transcriptional repressor NicR [Sulfitobacter sp. THAF37]|uniref:MarR family winged helix-turn-helix transcriptional regulator n=1 Tax=Sulfitobacter sp. THAF37 TaxID=2587855 RepID=UPI001268E562|nr:MarR family transcriptional regulator [Sulfitobacter sp. THAF37]QFT59947.1 HTH-type transcriptional repressor NicR [Sulfitobacter sp. THAF37]